MREPKGDWRDLFNGFMVALDLRKMLFAFMGLLFTLLAVGLLTFAWSHKMVDESHSGDSCEFPTAFTPHTMYQWFDLHWCGGNSPQGTPVKGIFGDHISNWNSGTFLALALVVFVIIWSYFGGAIARSAACEIAREGERIETSKALRYSGRKFWSFFGAPLICVLGFLFFYLVVYVSGLVFKVLDLLVIGSFLAAFLLPLAILGGFIMALIVVGTLAGFPLFIPAVAAEGTDAFDAFSRGFSYVYSKPWHYIWYQLVAGGYGYLCIAFVLLFAVFMTHLGLSAGEAGFELSGAWKTGGAEATGPTDFERVNDWAWSFVLSAEHSEATYGWTPYAIASDPHPYGRVMHLATRLGGPEVNYGADFPAEPGHHKYVAYVVLAWMIVIMGFAYSFAVSYFISQQTMIYFILRKKVDDIDVKEVYLEEDMDQIEGMTEEPPAPPPEKEEPRVEAKAKTKRETRKTKRSTKRTKRR